MDELTFTCVDIRAEAYAAFPTLVFRLRVTDPSPDGVHTIALRCQIRVEPRLRRYEGAEAEMLGDLFGDPARWGDTMKPLQFANVSVMIPTFTESTEIDVPVPCGYDLEVAAGRYFAALDDGEIPMIMLFSGTVFAKTADGFSVGQVPWHSEARCRLPVPVWRELMDRYFPDSGWLRLRRDTLRGLSGFKSARALATWDETLELLLKEARR